VILTTEQARFLEQTHSAAMIVVPPSGVAKAARVGIAMVDGRLWSSGTQGRARTGWLRRDPRCTLFVFEAGYSYLSVETSVTILDGPDAPELNARLFREMQGRPAGPLMWGGRELEEAAFLEAMRAEERLVYEFEIRRVSGLIAD